MRLRLPQVNLLSKVDLVEAYGQLAFNLDFYTEVTLGHAAILERSCSCTKSGRLSAMYTHHIAVHLHGVF